MTKKLVVSLSLSLLLVACGPSKQDLMNFNTKMVSVNSALQNEISTLSTSIDVAVKTGSFPDIAAKVKTTLTSIDQKQSEIEKYSTPKGGEKFKTAVLEYIKAIKESVKACEPLGNLTKDAGDDQVNTLLNKVEELYKNEDKKLKEAQDAQKDFAKANKMQLY